MYLSAKYYADLIGINTPIIASNGAFIKNGYDDKPIYENSLPKDIAVEIYKIAKKYGLTIQFNSWDVLFMETPASEEHAYVIMNRDLPEKKRVKFIVNERLDEAILSYEGNILKAGVIENSENDLSMINYAGIGVAMGNGLDIVKEAADYVTDTNDNSGVGKAIKHFVLDCNE